MTASTRSSRAALPWRRRNRLGCLALLLLSATLGGCGEDSPGGDRTGPAPDPFEARKLPDDLAPAAARVAEANNRFALDLHARLRETPGNLFYSPFSVATALEMTLAGARGATEEEMRRVLHLDAADGAFASETLHPAAGALVKSLDRGIALGGYRLSFANRLWGQPGAPLLEPFIATTRDDYGAGLEPVDFLAAPEEARGRINSWVAEKTEKRIENLMPPGSVTSLTRLVLTNAIYFKGAWETPFDTKLTRELPFHLNPGTDVTVPLMTREGAFRVTFRETFSAVELPYAGKDLSMLVVVPNAVDGLAALEAELTPENLAAWTEGLHEGRASVTIPRFTTTAAFSLNGTLAAMGMPSAFEDGAADFSGIDGTRELVIQAVVHKGFVSVNEEGTEAAAATGVSIGPTSLPPSVIADHPFLFLIRDHVTGSILFIGRIVDPRA